MFISLGTSTPELSFIFKKLLLVEDKENFAQISACITDVKNAMLEIRSIKTQIEELKERAANAVREAETFTDTVADVAAEAAAEHAQAAAAAQAAKADAEARAEAVRAKQEEVFRRFRSPDAKYPTRKKSILTI